MSQNVTEFQENIFCHRMSPCHRESILCHDNETEDEFKVIMAYELDNQNENKNLVVNNVMQHE